MDLKLDEVLPLLNKTEQTNIQTVLSLAEEAYGSLDDVSFFEFGSNHYAYPTYTPYSPGVSHYFINSEFEYNCFDPNADQELFLRTLPVVESIAKGKRDYGNEPISKEEFKSLALYAVESDINYFFPSRNDFKAYIEEFPQLLANIDEASLSYDSMLKRISSAKKPVVFSNNTLNVPSSRGGLDTEFPFWKIDDVLQIHTVCQDELLAKAGYNRGQRRLFYQKKIGSEEIDNIKQYLDVSNDVHTRSRKNNIGIPELSTLYWQS